MQLTRFTDLGLRVLMYLTGLEAGQLATIPEIAERFAISRNHLVKVVHFMAQQGWLATSRGKGGGLALARPPEHFRLGQVVRALEGLSQLIDCAEPPCALYGGCRLKGALDAALLVFFQTLDGYTLRDIIASPTGEAIIRMHRGLSAFQAEGGPFRSTASPPGSGR
ncbi:BadM/Rrf2 family transcriptional regulator [Chromobacterium sphagni]|uniref:BadM/Rrf2 family transcriptional regulator n=2 Tax=Chromobacterium sphagni TaxID=1903179 RepID=A0A1S1X610_9NEIS|nr:BadM/Rrf2 family transcriptional regulator [Chromobacterium sphagni]OHX22057.1 BadM/Rrf2 family transcriptional regulator [Chromobacterium sphagni]